MPKSIYYLFPFGSLPLQSIRSSSCFNLTVSLSARDFRRFFLSSFYSFGPVGARLPAKLFGKDSPAALLLRLLFTGRPCPLSISSPRPLLLASRQFIHTLIRLTISFKSSPPNLTRNASGFCFHLFIYDAKDGGRSCFCRFNLLA
eukprot:GHVT01017429.1.p2 GENE.GHVT01017429.1~~GHVT01017429.1.p2  ORF type:complete len:145 (-),score=15.34 GHVT01017429.1:393-827(-)